MNNLSVSINVAISSFQVLVSGSQEMWSQHLADPHKNVDEGKDFFVNIHVEITDNLLGLTH